MAELEQELGLRIDSALQAVAQLDRALTQLASDAGESMSTELAKGLQVDATPITTAVTGAVKDADTDVAVGDVDAAVVTGTIDESVRAADTDVTIAGAEAGVVTSSIESAATAADTSVDIAQPRDASVITDSIEGAVADADTTVTIEVDTGDAEQQLAGLTSASDETADSLGKIGTQATAAVSGTDAVGTAANVASGAVSVLGGNFQGIVGKAGPAGAAVVGVTTALGVFVGKAISSTETTARFASTFGDLAPAILQVDIGGLNLQLSDLTAKVGASSLGLKAAAADFGQLAIASGQTQREAATTAEQLIALSAAVSVLKPSLGTADEVIGGLTNSLARGGRSLANYGITLTAAEIQARAMANTGKATAAELTQVEKATAGAQLATEKYGNTLGSVVETGSKQASVQLRALKTEAFGAISSLGVPLIAPVLDVLKAAAPAIGGVVKIIGVGLQALTPAIKAVAVGFEILAPIIGVVADVLKFLSPVITVVVTGLIAMTGPIGLVVAGITLVGSIFGKSKEQTQAFNAEAAKTPPVLEGVGTAVDVVGQGLDGLPDMIKSVADTVAQSVPGIGAAFDKASKDTVVSLMSIQVALSEQLRAERDFFANVNFIIAAGGLAIAEELLKQGPVRGAAAAKAIGESTPFQIKALEAQAKELQQFDYDAGVNIARSLAEGYAASILASVPIMDTATIQAAKKVVATAKSPEGFDVRSPSRIFAEIGMQVGAGLALGIRSSLPVVGAAIGELQRFTVAGGNTTVNVTGGGGATTSAPVNQTIIVNAAADPEATAQAVSMRVLQGAQR